MNKVAIKEWLVNEFIPWAINDPVLVYEYGDNSLIDKYDHIFSSTMRLSISEEMFLNESLGPKPKHSLTDISKKLAMLISGISPKDIVTKQSNFLDRLLGNNHIRNLRTTNLVSDVEELISNGNEAIKDNTLILESLDAHIKMLSSDINVLELYIDSAKEYLEYKRIDTQSSYKNNHKSGNERFSNKVISLSLLLDNYITTEAQMKLSYGVCINAADQFIETSTILIPIWIRQINAARVKTSMEIDKISDFEKAKSEIVNKLSTVNSIR